MRPSRPMDTEGVSLSRRPIPFPPKTKTLFSLYANIASYARMLRPRIART